MPISRDELDDMQTLLERRDYIREELRRLNSSAQNSVDRIEVYFAGESLRGYRKNMFTAYREGHPNTVIQDDETDPSDWISETVQEQLEQDAALRQLDQKERLVDFEYFGSETEGVAPQDMLDDIMKRILDLQRQRLEANIRKIDAQLEKLGFDARSS